MSCMAADRPHHRPRHRQPARRQRQPDRQHAVRRLRPAPGLHHLQRAEPVPCRDGGGAALLADRRRRLQDIYVSTVGRRGQRHRGHQRGDRHRLAHGQHGQRAATAASIAGSSARNAATNALANTGKGSASAGRRRQHQQGNDGAAVGLHQLWLRATRRWRSTTRGCSSPARSRSTSPPASRSATPPRRSTRRCGRSACPPRIHGSFQGTAQTFQQSLTASRC